MTNNKEIGMKNILYPTVVDFCREVYAELNTVVHAEKIIHETYI